MTAADRPSLALDVVASATWDGHRLAVVDGPDAEALAAALVVELVAVAALDDLAAADVEPEQLWVAGWQAVAGADGPTDPWRHGGLLHHYRAPRLVADEHGWPATVVVEEVDLLEAGGRVLVVRRAAVSRVGGEVTPGTGPAAGRAQPLLRAGGELEDELVHAPGNRSAAQVAAVALKVVCDETRSALEGPIPRLARRVELHALEEAADLGAGRAPHVTAPLSLLTLRSTVSHVGDLLTVAGRHAPFHWTFDDDEVDPAVAPADGPDDRARAAARRSWVAERPVDDEGKDRPQTWRHLALGHVARATTLADDRTGDLTRTLQAVSATAASLHAVAQHRMAQDQRRFQSLVSRAGALIAVPSLVLGVYGANILVPGQNGKLGTVIVFVVSAGLIGLLWRWVSLVEAAQDLAVPDADRERAAARSRRWSVVVLAAVLAVLVALFVAVWAERARTASSGRPPSAASSTWV